MFLTHFLETRNSRTRFIPHCNLILVAVLSALSGNSCVYVSGRYRIRPLLPVIAKVGRRYPGRDIADG